MLADWMRVGIEGATGQSRPNCQRKQRDEEPALRDIIFVSRPANSPHHISHRVAITRMSSPFV
jgi:hypothetical protein